MFIGVSATIVWALRAQYAHCPFVELIDFFDNEGVIGTVVSKKLLTDFQMGIEKARQHSEPYFFIQYEKWMTAFEYASQDGYVDFH